MLSPSFRCLPWIQSRFEDIQRLQRPSPHKLAIMVDGVLSGFVKLDGSQDEGWHEQNTGGVDRRT